MEGMTLTPTKTRAVNAFGSLRILLATNLIALVSFGYFAFPTQMTQVDLARMRPRVTFAPDGMPFTVSRKRLREFA